MATRQNDNAEFWRIVGQGERSRQLESGELVSAGDAPFGFGRAALTRAAWNATGAADPERLLVVLASAKVAIVFHLVCAKGSKTGRLLYSAGPFAPDCRRVPLLIVSGRGDEGERTTTFMLPDEAAARPSGQRRAEEEGESRA